MVYITGHKMSPSLQHSAFTPARGDLMSFSTHNVYFIDYFGLDVL